MLRPCLPLLSAILIPLAGCSRPDPPDPKSVSAETRQTIQETESPQFAEDDWPWWRGPQRNGHAVGSLPGIESMTESDAKWKTDIPGRGHGTPVVVGDRLFLSTADEIEKTQSVYCLDRNTGDVLWSKMLFDGGLVDPGHTNGTHASNTIACDEKHEFVLLLNEKSSTEEGRGTPHVWLTALDRDGEQVWQVDAGPFRPKFHYSASPVVYRSLVIIAMDHDGGGSVQAFDRTNGKLAWRTPRKPGASFATPVIANVGGKDQLLLGGLNMLTSFDPVTGQELWSVAGTADSAVGTPVWSGDVVMASGGYPQRNTVAVDASSGDLLWSNGTQVYEPSMLTHVGHLFIVDKGGKAFCYDVQSGDQKWRGRVGGNYSASPVLVGDTFITCGMDGNVQVIAADPSKFRRLHQFSLGDEIFASPVVCGGELFIRAASRRDGKRIETVYCLAKE